MKNVIRGILIITGILLAFMLITACAPNRALTKDQGKAVRDSGNRTGEGTYEYTFNDNKKGHEVIEDGNGDINKDNSSGMKAGDSSLKKEKFYQTGMASWYGREFNGKITASGERFDMKKLTAAHRTLPLGTILTVKNLNNGETVQVKINDRGPYKKGRILDLSYAAAKKLDIISDGEALVGINILKNGKSTRVIGSLGSGDDIEGVSGDTRIKDDIENSTSDLETESLKNSGTLSLQVGAFYSRKKAETLKKRLEEEFNSPVVMIHENDFYKVRIEGIKSRKEADKFRNQLKKEDIFSYIVEGNE